MLEFLGGDREYWAIRATVFLIGFIIMLFLWKISVDFALKYRNTLDKYRTRFGFNTEIEFSEVKDVNKVAKREFYYNRRIEKEKQKLKDKEKRGPVT